MLKIGEFSKMSKVTVKALRYYEKEKLIIPKHIDKLTGYRYYENNQLIEIARIMSLKQVGLSIEEIKEVIINNRPLDDILKIRKNELEKTICEYNYQLSKLNYLLEEKDMKEDIFEKVIPSYYIYYKDGMLKDYSEVSRFIQKAGMECLELNPEIKCVEPDYCFVNYLDGEYREKNIKIRYAQAVVKNDKQFKENEYIKFMDLPETKCICIYHKGTYNTLGISYGKIIKYIEDNKLQIVECPRECYIDGIWNKENVEEWLTEIQVPIK